MATIIITNFGHSFYYNYYNEIHVTLFFARFVSTFLCLYERFSRNKFISICLYTVHFLHRWMKNSQKRKNFHNFLFFRFDYREIIAMAQRRSDRLEIHVSGTWRDDTRDNGLVLAVHRQPRLFCRVPVHRCVAQIYTRTSRLVRTNRFSVP